MVDIGRWVEAAYSFIGNVSNEVIRLVLLITSDRAKDAFDETLFLFFLSKTLSKGGRKRRKTVSSRVLRWIIVEKIMEIEKLIEREGKWIWIKKDVQKARLGSVSFDYPSRRREKVMKPDKRREDHRRLSKETRCMYRQTTGSI